MKLDRKINGSGGGKYGLVRNRRLAEIRAWSGGDGEIAYQLAVEEAVALLERAGVIEWGYPEAESEFFVVKLRDKYAHAALYSYYRLARFDDVEYAEDIHELAFRSGPYSKFCKMPD